VIYHNEIVIKKIPPVERSVWIRVTISGNVLIDSDISMAC